MQTQEGEETVRLVQQAGGKAVYVNADLYHPADAQALVPRAVCVFVTGAYYPVDGGFLAH